MFASPFSWKSLLMSQGLILKSRELIHNRIMSDSLPQTHWEIQASSQLVWTILGPSLISLPLFRHIC
jgi:hypothetical protein